MGSRGASVYDQPMTTQAASTYSHTLAELQLPDPDGNLSRLGDFWQDDRAVVVFLRHYG